MELHDVMESNGDFMNDFWFAKNLEPAKIQPEVEIALKKSLQKPLPRTGISLISSRNKVNFRNFISQFSYLDLLFFDHPDIHILGDWPT